MGLHFIGGERIQKGKGIGGLLRFASKLFLPISRVAKKAIQSNTGKKIVDAVKEQAIDSSINLASDIVQGKDIKESFKNEFDNVKDKTKIKAVEIGLDYLKGKSAKRRKKEKKQKLKKTNTVKNRGRVRDIFS